MDDRPNNARTKVAQATQAVWQRSGRLVLLVFLVLVGVSFGCSSYYTVEQGERGIVTRWGAITAIAEPGLGFKLPMIDTVTPISIRSEKVTWERVTAYSKDIQPAEMRVSVNVRLDPAFVAEVYTNYGADYVERIVWPVVPKVLEEVFGQYQAATVVANRTQLGLDYEKAVRAKIPQGIIIESIQIENVDFSDNYERSIEAAAQAEAMVRTKENEKRQAQVDAEKTIIQAEALNKQRKLEADSQAYQIESVGRAEAASINAKGAALRDNPALVSLTAAEKWDGTLPTTMIPGSTVPFIQVPGTPTDLRQ